MERKIIGQLKLWKDNPERKPLILLGARQVGKIWVIAIIGAMKIGLKKRSQLWLALKEPMLRGVQIIVFVKIKNEQSEDLQREGLTVRVADGLMLQLVVSDSWTNN